MVEITPGEIPVPRCRAKKTASFYMRTVPYSKTIKLIVDPPIRFFCEDGNRNVSITINTGKQVGADICAGDSVLKIPPCPFYNPKE